MPLIKYYVPNHTLLDATPYQANRYREWALIRLMERYPNHTIDVSPAQLDHEVVTDDEANCADIIEYTGHLWSDWNTLYNGKEQRNER